MSNKRLRIANKFRFTLFLTFTCLLLMLLISNLFKSDAAYSDNENKYIEIIVMKGDTVWQIAKKNNPNNYDIRKVVHEIMKINEMKNANIKPGDTIKIPAY